MSNFTQYIIAVALFLATFVLTLLIRHYAIARSIIDIPNKRSSHSVPTPRGGGLAIVIVWFTYITILHIRHEINPSFYYALLSGILICMVSFFDDIHNLSPKVRLVTQLVSVIIALIFLGGLQSVDLGFIVLSLPLWTNIILIFLFIWIINLFNFLDGIDGYLGTEGVFLFAAIALFAKDILALNFGIIILGFLVLNWPKAKIFSGDVGSTLIGYTFMVFAVQGQNDGRISLLIPLTLSGLFWMDATVTLFRRIKKGERISEPHNKHAYQRLFQGGLTHLRIVLLGLSINFLLLIITLVLYRYSYTYLLVAMLFQVFILTFYIRYADRKMKFK